MAQVTTLLTRVVKQGFIILTISLLLCVIFGELFLRFFGPISVYEYDKELGWRPVENLSIKKTVFNQGGDRYEIDYVTHKYGFRMYDSEKNGYKRILFIGDSYTQHPYTSNEDAYFGVVSKQLPLTVFTTGGGGYGTLQQLLLTRRYIKEINPDIFVLQYCTNDIKNNSFDIESRTIVRNQKNLRPYMVNGEIIYRLPRNSFYLLLYNNSQLFRTLDLVFQKIQFKFYGGYMPQLSKEDEEQLNKDKERAIQLTRQLMIELKELMPDRTKSLTFSCRTNKDEDTEIWKSMAKESGYDIYPSVSMIVEDAEQKGDIIRVSDGAHWNRLGHKIVGNELVRIISENYLH